MVCHHDINRSNQQVPCTMKFSSYVTLVGKDSFMMLMLLIEVLGSLLPDGPQPEVANLPVKEVERLPYRQKRGGIDSV